jgi:metacaspase-1
MLMAGHALHIGLNHVDPAQYGGWDGKLQGCLNDAASIKSLAESAGFSTTTLLDEAATAAGVTAALGVLAAGAAGGDLCLVSYSGHGGQIADEDGDEEEGLDETWVCYDRQLLDDELHLAWSQFPAGVRVLVISDSCHSGSVVRDDVNIRISRGMPDDERQRDNELRGVTYKTIKQQVAARGDLAVAASVLLLSGCQDDQVSYDGDGNGAFTQSLLQTWADGAFEGDYPAFHAAIVANMTTNQTPNLNEDLVADPAFTAEKPFTL